MDRIEYRQGNILKSSADVLVNPVNCVGTSGAGLALAFKKWCPTSQVEYERVCKTKSMRPGDLLPVVSLARGATIYYVATKDHWRDPSRFEWVVVGLDAIIRHVFARYTLGGRPHTLAIPALGCGNGGLAWADVKPIMQLAAEKMAAVGTRVWIYEPRA